MGARQMNRKADRWGPAGSDSRRSGWARGRERRAGTACGPRARTMGKWEGVGRPAGLASLGRAAGCEAFSLFLFLFYFSSPLFKFQIDMKFEFKIGVP